MMKAGIHGVVTDRLAVPEQVSYLARARQAAHGRLI
jgi:hypothetical protein